MAVNTTVQVTLPAMGESVREGTVLEFHGQHARDDVAEVHGGRAMQTEGAPLPRRDARRFLSEKETRGVAGASPAGDARSCTV